jgi:uncharacterized protein
LIIFEKNIMPFKRNLLTALQDWKVSKNRKPLILKGARQVGKTSLLKQFGQEAFAQTAYFNFEEKPDLKQLFVNTKDITSIIKNLSLLHGTAITASDTLIIFDEIQECNEALNTLKYFNENAPEYAIACAGSLLGITLGKNKSFPVGKVDFMSLYPLSFMEFLHASNNRLYNYLRQLDAIVNIPDIFFNEVLALFKLYFVSGGMPEPASYLAFENDIAAAEKSLQNILTSYTLDFSKHAATKDIAKINYVWNAIPSQLAKENKKFLYQAIKPGARAREYEDALNWLTMAGLMYKLNLCNKPALPLSAYDNLGSFKLFTLDVGLLRLMSQLHHTAFIEGDRMFTEFKGALTENYVLQSLIPALDNLPRYWTSDGKAEIDFLIQYENDIIPIEVKADKNIQSKSLALYNQIFQPKLRIRFSLKNLTLDGNLLNIPLFMADNVSSLIAVALKEISKKV